MSASSTPVRIGLAAWLSLAACGPPGVRASHDLVDTAAIPWRFMARQRVHVHRGEHTRSFDVVLQHDGVLRLIVLTPFATKAFVITQTGGEVTMQEHTDFELPIAARDILLDVHRALFMGSWEPHSDGQHRIRRGGERIEETWQGGRLLRRTFERRGRTPEGTIVIDYAGGWHPGEAPPRIHFVHGFGYALTIETLAYAPL